MKTTIIYISLIISSFLVSSLDCSPIADLQAARAQLVAGQKSIAEGKKGVIEGYNYIKSNVIETMNNAADGVGSQMIDLDKQKNIISDVLNKKLPALFGYATAVTAIYPPAVVIIYAVPSLEAVLWDFPKTFDGINSTLSSIVDTLRSVVNTITPANEKLNPKNMIALLQRGQSTMANIKQTIQDNGWWFNDGYKNNLNGIVDTLAQQIQAAQANIDPIKEKSRDISAMEGIEGTMEGKRSDIDAAKKAIAESTTLENYFKIKDDAGADISGDTKADRAKTTTTILNQLVNFMDEFKAQIARDNNNEDIPLVYQKFNSANQKFDAAIKKIDDIVDELTQLEAIANAL